jgi:glucose-1-phosphate adenylyltransferase
MITEHIKKDADITISTFTVQKNKERFGILASDEKNKVISFEEKPENPKSDQASMGIYVFKTEKLKELLEKDKSSNFDFGNDIIPLALKENYRVYSYPFNGYFKDVGTIKSLFETNMDLIDNPQYLKLHEYVDFPIFTRSSNLPPHHIGEKCQVTNSLISDGCLVYGDLDHAILSSGVVIEHSAKLENCIVHSGVRVGKMSYIKNAIIVENAKILPSTKLVFDDVTVIDNEYLWKIGDQDE